MANAPRIAVVGSANTDLITFSDAFPRPGETVFGRSFDLGFGGKGANQAIAARLCGAEVVMVAKVGSDLFGEATIRNFASFGIDTTHVQLLPGVSTGVAPIFVEPGGQNRIIVVKGANDRLLPKRAASIQPHSARIAFSAVTFSLSISIILLMTGDSAFKLFRGAPARSNSVISLRTPCSRSLRSARPA